MSEQLINSLSQELSKYGITASPSDGFDTYLQSLRQGIVNYEIQTSWVWIWTSIAFIVVGLISLIVAVKKRKDWDEAAWVLGVCALFIIIVCIIIIGTQAHDIATCNAFPDKVVYEHVRYALRQFLSNNS